MTLSPTPGSTCLKVTCGIPFSTASIKCEVFFQEVVKYSCEEGYSVAGSVGEAALSRGVARAVAIWIILCQVLKLASPCVAAAFRSRTLLMQHVPQFPSSSSRLLLSLATQATPPTGPTGERTRTLSLAQHLDLLRD